jgi:hypothetical protein
MQQPSSRYRRPCRQRLRQQLSVQRDLLELGPAYLLLLLLLLLLLMMGPPCCPRHDPQLWHTVRTSASTTAAVQLVCHWSPAVPTEASQSINSWLAAPACHTLCQMP